MGRFIRCVGLATLLAAGILGRAQAQKALTWDEVKTRFEANNPTLPSARFAYEHGGASLLDFVSAENDYRSVQLNYVNLIGAYLTAAAQLDLAVGREEIQ
jgi:outer membrane protein TolC